MSQDNMGYSATTVPQGSRVVLIVSTGEPPRSTTFATMPDVLGRNQGAALEEIAKTSLQTQVVYDYHPHARKGTVTAMRPAAGTNALVGTDALVLVSSGEPMGPRPIASLPNVVGLDEASALEEIRGAGLNAQVMYEASATVPAGYVIDQLPNQMTYASMRKSARKSRLWTIVAAVLLALVLATVAFFALGGMDLFAKEKVIVPDVIGMSEADAVAALDEVGLVAGKIADKEATEQFPDPGTVLASDPEAGKEVAKGSSVNLEVVIDPTRVRADVPNVVGKKEADAVALLEKEGFSVITETISSTRFDEGVVAEQSPAAGTRSHKDAQVTIRVSSGPGDVVVPDLIGLSQDTAQKLLENVGLKFTVATSPSNSVPAGAVMSASPASGSSVKPGTTVALIVSSGSNEPPPVVQKITIPNYAGWNALEAQRNLSEIGLIGVLSPPDGDGQVQSSSPAAGTKVEKGSTVTLKVVSATAL